MTTDHIVVVVAENGGVGKTTLAVTVAVGATQSGRKVPGAMGLSMARRPSPSYREGVCRLCVDSRGMTRRHDAM